MPEATRPAPAPLANLRDLGGIAVHGGRIRPGLVLRSDDVATTTPAQVAELVAAGLSTIIDLRSAQEAQRTGRGPSADHPVRYLALPLTDTEAAPPDLAGQFLAAVRTPEHVGQWYAKMFTARKESLVQGLEAVAEAPGTVLFHCAAGKDRTGMFAAALLAVLGAGPDAIADDYSRTQERLPEVYRRMGLADLAGGTGIPLDHPVLAAHPTAMRTMLDVLDSRSGGITGVLRAGGLTTDLAGRLHAKLVQPAPSGL